VPRRTISFTAGGQRSRQQPWHHLSLNATLQDYSSDASPTQSLAFSVTNPLTNYTAARSLPTTLADGGV